MAMQRNLLARIMLLMFLIAPCARTQPLPPLEQSPWNLLVAGGKGIYGAKPVCRQLRSFSNSPLLFDFEQDFFGVQAADLEVTTEATPLDEIGGRKVMQIIQRVRRARENTNTLLKRLVVQRADSDFCAIYQQVYDAALITMKPASVIAINGKPVLKTLDQNGKETWNEEYWAFGDNGPIHLDPHPAYQQMKAAVPDGERLSLGPFNLEQSCHKVDVWKSNGDCQACGSFDGVVLAKLAIRGEQISATWVHRFPSQESEACPP